MEGRRLPMAPLHCCVRAVRSEGHVGLPRALTVVVQGGFLCSVRGHKEVLVLRLTEKVDEVTTRHALYFVMLDWGRECLQHERFGVGNFLVSHRSPSAADGLPRSLLVGRDVHGPPNIASVVLLINLIAWSHFVFAV